MTDNKKCISYIIWAFCIAWALQFAAAFLYKQGNGTAYTMVLSISMFAPLLAVILSGNNIKEIGWKPNIKRNIRYILLAWLMPAVLGAVGAALYYILFPASFDTEFGYIISQIGAAGVAQLEERGMTLPLYAVVSCVSALSYGPFLNMFLAVGEEAGWRGAMYPLLKARFGTTKGRIIGGVIWGAWHWPVMILTGYEYGTGYFGEPVTGMALFCVITTAMGILLDFVYERTDSIWVPALGHGAINAFAGMPVLFLKAVNANHVLLGPLMIGLIGGLPMILTAVFVSSKERTE